MKEKTIHSNIRGLMAVLAILLFVAICFSPVMAAPIPAPRHISVVVSNEAGARFSNDATTFGGPANSYYIKADGGGLNELHISNDPANQYGQVATTNNLAGTFWITNTGGRGFDDNVPILVSVHTPEIPNDFAIHIKSSGYSWTPSTVANQAPTVASYVTGVDETFTGSDFIYGPQAWKPGPGSLTVPSLPLYFGQNINDPSTNAKLMFVDPYVGNLKSSNPLSVIDGGAAKVEYTISGVDSLPTNTVISFNGYGWCLNANQGQGISWTNQITGASASGYSVVYNPPVADFTADNTAGLPDLTVAFTDASTGAGITSWAWDFGDGATSTEQNPTHTYTDVGKYSVSLIVTSPAGSGTETKTDFITVQTSAEATADLIAHVQSLGLKPSVETGLTDKLYDAVDELNAGNKVAPANILNAFIKQVKAQTKKAITPSDASALTAEAQAIINNIQAV